MIFLMCRLGLALIVHSHARAGNFLTDKCFVSSEILILGQVGLYQLVAFFKGMFISRFSFHLNYCHAAVVRTIVFTDAELLSWDES